MDNGRGDKQRIVLQSITVESEKFMDYVEKVRWGSPDLLSLNETFESAFLVAYSNIRHMISRVGVENS